jgi:hypothetical protein
VLTRLVSYKQTSFFKNEILFVEKELRLFQTEFFRWQTGSSSQKKSRPCQTKRVRKKKDLVEPISAFFLPNKILFDQKKSRPKQMRLFWPEKILSGKTKDFFRKKRFCPARTKLFLANGDFVR